MRALSTLRVHEVGMSLGRRSNPAILAAKAAGEWLALGWCARRPSAKMLLFTEPLPAYAPAGRQCGQADRYGQSRAA